MILLVGSNSFAVPYCPVCKKEIVGQALIVDGIAYHPQCLVCAICNKPMADRYTSHQGKFYHPECYLEHFAPRCAVCGIPLEGAYIQHEGSYYHEQCYLDSVAARCDYCDEPILGRYIENEWGQRIHEEHRETAPRCDSCNRFISAGQGWQLTDGRYQCPYCRANAVDTPTQASKLFARASGMLAQKGIHLAVPTDQIELILVNRNQLNDLSMQYGRGDNHGLTKVETETRNGRIINRSITVYLLNHLPEELFLGIAGHELFHVWQNEHEADGGDSAWREGSANVAMHLILETLRTDLARYQIEQLLHTKDSDYGDGYRRALSVYQNQGVQSFLRAVEKHCR